MDVHDKLDELAALIEGARSMPMSASCIVNRGEVLGLLDELRELLPEEFEHAELLLRDREAVVDEGRVESARIIGEAQAERDRLVSETEIARVAQEQAEQLRSDAWEEVEGMRREVDDYVDAKLANFEVVLDKTLAAVHRGRDKLRGRSEMDDLSGGSLDELPLPE